MSTKTKTKTKKGAFPAERHQPKHKKRLGFELSSKSTFYVVANSKGQLCAYDENSGRHWLMEDPENNKLDYAERLSLAEATKLVTCRDDNGFSFLIPDNEVVTIYKVESQFEATPMVVATEEIERQAAIAKLTARERQLLKIDSTQTMLFIVEVEEHDSFSDRKIDGYRAYAKSEVAQKFVDEFYAERSRSSKKDKTPSYYVNYNILGWREASAARVQEALKAGSGFVYLDTLEF